jgi:MFS family permease
MTQTLALKKDPPAFLRWVVLIFISLAMFGNYYIYDCISPLADVLKTQLHFTDGNLGLLQGIYSIPNIFMVLIGGIIIDKIGTKKAALIFACLVFLGALFTTVKGDIVFMATGRLIFGLGAESMIVAITTIIARWFKGKELSGST